jgi:hypothetical protein
MTTQFEEVLASPRERLLRGADASGRRDVVEGQAEARAAFQRLAAGAYGSALSEATRLVNDDPRFSWIGRAGAGSASSFSGRVLTANAGPTTMVGAMARVRTTTMGATAAFFAGSGDLSVVYGGPVEPGHEVVDASVCPRALLILAALNTSDPGEERESLGRSADPINRAAQFANTVLQEVITAGRLQGAIALVYSRFDEELLVRREFAGVRLALFAAAQTAAVAIDVLLSMLTATIPWKRALPERAAVINAVRARARREYGEHDAEAMLRGLA